MHFNSRHRSTGFSLLEAITSLSIIAAALLTVGLLTAFVSTKISDPVLNKKSLLLAESLLAVVTQDDELKLIKKYCDPSFLDIDHADCSFQLNTSSKWQDFFNLLDSQKLNSKLESISAEKFAAQFIITKLGGEADENEDSPQFLQFEVTVSHPDLPKQKLSLMIASDPVHDAAQ